MLKILNRNRFICGVLCLMLAGCTYYFCKHILLSYVAKSTHEQVLDNNLEPVNNHVSNEDAITIIKSNNECLKNYREETGDLDKCLKSGNESSFEINGIENAKITTLHDDQVGKGIITGIEWLLISGLSLQLYLTVYTIFFEKSPVFDFYIFHLSDWAINTPPILGVLANLLAFSLVLSQGTDKIMELFNGYFYEATVTTLIGGLFYIINLGLKVIIQSRLDSLKI